MQLRRAVWVLTGGEFYGSKGANAAAMVNEAARVAQLVEHTLGKGEVIGSIPIASLY
jgi:hypothetical protein